MIKIWFLWSGEKFGKIFFIVLNREFVFGLIFFLFWENYVISFLRYIYKKEMFIYCFVKNYKVINNWKIRVWFLDFKFVFGV